MSDPFPIFTINEIAGSECIGDSRTKINTNFNNLSASANFANMKVVELSGKWANSTAYSPNETAGYIILASGLIIQWGKVDAVTENGYKDVLFPYQGMTKIFNITTSHILNVTSPQTIAGPCSIGQNYSTTGFRLCQDTVVGSSGGSISEMWMAIGT